MGDNSPFISLLLITALAAFVPLFASRLQRLRMPIVVGEILAGILVGSSGLNLIETSPTLDFLALFGFAYLMFLSGLEVDFASLNTSSDDGGRSPGLTRTLVLGFGVFSLTIAASVLSAGILFDLKLVREPFMMALILSTTSLGIVVPVLKERQLIGSSYGQAILFSALIADFGTLLLITVEVSFFKHGSGPSLLLVLLLLVVFALIIKAAKLAAAVPALGRFSEELAHATAQIHVRGAVAVMVAFIVLSEWLGIEVILGAFLAGVLISILSRQDRTRFLRMKMDAIGFGFFIPIFFIMVGVRFDLPALVYSGPSVLLIPLLLVTAYAVKFIAGLPFRFFFTWKETLAAGGLLSARLSLIIAASAIALELGVIDVATNAAVILVALFTCTISPLLFNRFHPPPGRGAVRQGVIVVGLGEIPVLLAERLQSSGKTVTLLGTDPAQIRRLRARKMKVLKGDPGTEKALRAAGADTAELVVAVSTRDEVNVAACAAAIETFSIPRVIAQAAGNKAAESLERLGVKVVRPQMATALALEGALYFPTVFDVLTDQSDGVEVREARLGNPALFGKTIRNVRLPGDGLVIGVRRRGEVLVPRGDTKLRQGDLLMLVGSLESLEKAMRTISGP